MSDPGWYFSFADNDGFRGACQVTASSLDDAITKTWKLGINPGGEILSLGPMDVEDMDGPFDVLLVTKEEVVAALGPCSNPATGEAVG